MKKLILSRNTFSVILTVLKEFLSLLCVIPTAKLPPGCLSGRIYIFHNLTRYIEKLKEVKWESNSEILTEKNFTVDLDKHDGNKVQNENHSASWKLWISNSSVIFTVCCNNFEIYLRFQAPLLTLLILIVLHN